jgi:serine/threonine protein kinase
MPVKRCDGGSPGPSAPLTVVRPCHPKKLIQFCLEDPKICVTDFGESFFTADRNTNRELQTAVSVAAPEILLQSWSLVGPPSDIWSLACMLWEILSNTMLFAAIFPRRRYLLVEIETTLDSANLVPPSWRFKVPEGRKVNRGLQVRMSKFNKNVDEGHRFDELELAELTRLFVRMLKWDPGDRITAADVVEGLPSRWRSA